MTFDQKLTMKRIIIYKGKYGATRQYAEWLGEQLGMPVTATENIKGRNLRDVDIVIIGTSVYIGKLQVSKWINENLEYLKNKKVFIFLVAGTPPDQKQKLQEYIKAGVPKELQVHSDIFFLPGRLNIAGLSWKDRFLLKMGARLTKDPVERKNMLTDYNNVKKENLGPLLKRVKEYCGVSV
jgi:menaquinone-dependent protoporphyrinogen IX oxidase